MILGETTGIHGDGREDNDDDQESDSSWIPIQKPKMNHLCILEFIDMTVV